jgi:hypothetical protein
MVMAVQDIRFSNDDRARMPEVAPRASRWAALIALGFLCGCSSVGNVGMITPASSDPGALLTQQRSYTEVGPVTGQACRYFLLGLIPWGDSSPTKAVEEALASSEGDAIINASIETSLYGFIPIYNVFSFTCTTVQGVAIKFT